VSFQHGTNAQFYIAGYDGTGFCNKVSGDESIDTAEVTVLGNTAKDYIPGLEDATVAFSGYFDGDADVDVVSFSYALDSIRRTQCAAVYLPQLDSNGGLAYSVDGFLTSCKIETGTDDAGTFEAEFQTKNALERSVTVHTLGSESATDASTGIDQSDATDNGASAVLQVLEVAGTATPTLTVKVQHSSDSTNGTDGTWVDLITFDAATTVGGQVKRVTGTVNQWVRVQWTISGTTPSFEFYVGFSRK
jgi:hypothetical protein